LIYNMEEISPEVIQTLTEHANAIVAGKYENVDKLFELTDETKNSADVANLAEAFGMMSVKIEAREFSLEMKIEELKKKNEHIELLQKTRTQLNSIFLSIVLLVTSYIFVLGILKDERFSHERFLKIFLDFHIVDIISIFVVIRLIRVCKFKIKDFGVTLTGWKRSVIESLIVSAVMIGVIMLVKHLIMQFYPLTFNDTQIFNFKYLDISFIFYLLVAPVQEFLARGIVQGTLEKLLAMKNKIFIAIMVTTFMFGALHMAYSFNLAMASFVTSWVWGWMYHRHQNLTGVSISHFLIGIASGLMGFWQFF
jgi:membrane protease YdiL (CAAX protease family)